MYRFAKFASNASFSLALALGLLLAYATKSQAVMLLECNWYRFIGTDFLFCTGTCTFNYLSCMTINLHDEFMNYLGTACTCLF
jgi:hypothetical protein